MSGAAASESDRARFEALARKWKEERNPYTSSVAELIDHPAYREIVGMGQVAVPLMLREFQTEAEPDFWFNALRTITGVNPVPKASRGKLDEMARAWVEWGIREGYLSDESGL